MPYPIRPKPWRGGPNWNMVHAIRLLVNQAPAAPANPALEAAMATAMSSGYSFRRHVGTIPRGAILLPAQAIIYTAFSASVTIDIGLDSGTAVGAQLIPTASIAPTVAGFKANIIAGSQYALPLTADLAVYAVLGGVAAGTTPAAGYGDFIIPYYHNGD